MNHYIWLNTEFGKMLIEEDGIGICKVTTWAEETPLGEEKETLLLRDAKLQMNEYLEGKRRNFELSLSMKGTTFQQEVWKALREIPYGETRSYQAIARAVGRPKACRAVGMANHVNPVGIIVPCHRVVGSNGKLTGYAGGLDMKKKLLEMEKSRV